MALDNFKRMNIIINNIHEKMDIPYLEANADEYNGRILRIQLTNNGVVEDQKATITFGFIHTANKEIKGVVSVPLVDKSKGIYELTYPTEMLKVGIVACAIKIIDGDNISVKRFKVEVTPSLFTGDMEVAPNSISAFDKALIDINSHEGRIVEMELNFKELAKMLTTNIPNMDATVSSRASQTSVDKIDGKITYLAKESSLTSIKSDLSTLKSRGCMKRVQRGEITQRTKGWYDYDSSNLSFLKALTITLPYSVNVSKAKASLYITSSESNLTNATCFISGENNLRIIINRDSVNDNSVESGVYLTWVVEEWY